MRTFLENPNVQHYLAHGGAEWVANALAVDYLRKMNVDERPGAMAWLETNYPAMAQLVRRDYPHHTV